MCWASHLQFLVFIIVTATETFKFFGHEYLALPAACILATLLPCHTIKVLSTDLQLDLTFNTQKNTKQASSVKCFIHQIKATESQIYWNKSITGAYFWLYIRIGNHINLVKSTKS